MTKITATVKEACQMSGLGKTKLYELMSQGKLETTTVGRRRLVKVESLRALVAA
ncbi:MAG: helix-turn-helix domain-containing protein [Sphingobium sp.]|uniref:helix-turn-helix domain-containing protein n=1 Tax=Sphingobium sp. TaxID=1912891 RepID=UPI000C522B13|nr:helix-turn-helix domain-containing protein [Sphingobium sp.]MBA4753616.1 helix-turn-helix domain-containing protein [Sphingobium sp.]MBS89000.1 excisionase [Sphingobium sp.]